MVRSRMQIVFILVFFLGLSGFSQDKKVDEHKNKKLKEEILRVLNPREKMGCGVL
jgi:hypothetical protein